MEVGKPYRYSEDGAIFNVTLLSHNKEEDGAAGDWNSFRFQVNEILSCGPFKPEAMPKIGSELSAGYREGYKHYAGWSASEL